MKKVFKITSLIIIFIIMFATFISVNAATDINPFLKETTSAAQDTGKVLNSVLGVIQVIGMAVAIIMLMVLGIKYMISSVSDRAEIKKHAVIYVVGAVLLFGASGIVSIIKKFATNIK